jgi:tripartite-type tricarboxylate transporter receptor subunit TctC
MNKAFSRVLLVLLLAAVVSIAGCGGTDSGQDLEPGDFYEGKTIELIVSGSAGGRTDRLSRVLASYIEGDTGANVVVTNMDQAGGMAGINHVYRSEPDGPILGTVPSLKFVSNKVLDEPVAAYGLSDFSYILGVGQRRYCLLVSPDGPYQSIADLQAGEDLLFGGSSPSGPISLGGMTAIEILGLDAMVVTGFNSEADRGLAVARGETDGYVQNPMGLSSVAEGLVEPLFILGTTRDPLLPDVPAITELTDVDASHFELAELWDATLVGATILIAPPGIPENRLTFLRDLSTAWTDDQSFRIEVNRVMGYELQVYTSGEAVEASMVGLADDLDEYREAFAEMIEKYRA